MPGCGKTTFGKILAKELDYDFLDFDDDVIEVSQWQSVAETLQYLWEEKFLELEESLTLGLNFQNTILATSGSVPLRKK